MAQYFINIHDSWNDHFDTQSNVFCLVHVVQPKVGF